MLLRRSHELPFSPPIRAFAGDAYAILIRRRARLRLFCCRHSAFFVVYDTLIRVATYVILFRARF